MYSADYRSLRSPTDSAEEAASLNHAGARRPSHEDCRGDPRRVGDVLNRFQRGAVGNARGRSEAGSASGPHQLR